MNPILQIKDRLSILDVVSTYVTVEKSGQQYKARCPFHNEKTPSFYISPSRNSYHCFGCNKGGDIFSFIEEIEHIPFREALTLLADRAGVALHEYKKNQTEISILDILESAASFFVSELQKNAEASLYIRDRGLFPETIEVWRIGFAPLSWRSLTEHLVAMGYPLEDIEKAGLSIKTEKGYYDRFRGRIMFPIMNPSGKVVGFTGRVLPSVEKGSDKPLAKYVNTPETAAYHKSKILFGYDKAKKSIVEKGVCVVVEGQMDVIMSHQAGCSNTVAVSGTAFTEEQITLIKRLTKTVVLCFDADEAGLAAMKRSAQLSLLSDIDVYVIAPPDAKDPAELIQKNADLWHEAVNAKVPLITFMLQFLRKRNIDERDFSRAVSKEVIPLLSSMINKIEQGQSINEVANTLKISKEAVESEVRKGVQIVPQKETPEVVRAVSEESSIQKILDSLVGLITLSEMTVKDASVQKLEKILSREKDKSLISYTELPLEIINGLAIIAEAEHKKEEDRGKEIEILFSNLEEALIQKRLLILQKAVQSETDENKAELLSLEHHSLAKKLDELKRKRSH